MLWFHNTGAGEFMHERITEILVSVSGYVWGLPLILLLLGTGIYLTIILRGLQIWTLLPALRLAFLKKYQESDAEGDISLPGPDDGPVGDGRRRQHSGRRDGHSRRRPRGPLLDVDYWPPRNGHQILRSRPRRKVQGGR